MGRSDRPTFVEGWFEMGTQAATRTGSIRRLVVIALAVSLFAAVVAASAAALGVNSGQVSTFYLSGTVPVPSVIADDDFVGCNSHLNGWSDSLGNVWTDHGGSWQCLNNDLARARWRLPLAHASVDVGVSDDIMVSTTLERISDQNNRSGPGLALFTDGFFHMYLIYERDQGRVTLGQLAPWQTSPLMSVPISDHLTATISVVVDQPSLTVLVNGSPIGLSYSMTPQQIAQFGSQTRFGLEADGDNWSRFDSFKVDTLP